MSGGDWAAIFVAVISIGSAIFSGRAARSAAKYNSDASMMNSKTQAETEAYQRARKMDVQTIERQDEEIEEIRKNNQELRMKVRTLVQANQKLSDEIQQERQDNEALRRRVSRLERQVGENSGQ